MRRLIPWIGWLYIVIGVASLFAWFLGHPSRWFGQLIEGRISMMVAGGLMALIVFGILMVVGESDSRGK